jgi:hypothetical protein
LRENSAAKGLRSKNRIGWKARTREGR